MQHQIYSAIVIFTNDQKCLPLPFGLTTLSVNGEPLRKNEEEWLTSGSPPWYIQDKYKPEQRELLVNVQVSLNIESVALPRVIIANDYTKKCLNGADLCNSD